MYMLLYVCMYVCTWKPEVYTSSINSPSDFWRYCLSLNLELIDLAGPANLGDFSVSDHPVLGLQAHTAGFRRIHGC